MYVYKIKKVNGNVVRTSQQKFTSESTAKEAGNIWLKNNAAHLRQFMSAKDIVRMEVTTEPV